MTSELRNPLVLSIDIGRSDPSQSVDSMLARTGQNTGNLLFSCAVHGLFEDAKRIPFNFPGSEVAEMGDCVVIAAANWLHESTDFGDIADQLEATNLPIIALGLGAQASVGGKIPRLKSGTQKLVSLLAERSPLIAARGTFSCEVLEHYGAKNAIATGCPSLLQHGELAPDFSDRATESSLQAKDITIHSTRHHFHKTDAFQTYLYRQSIQKRHNLLLQSELADFYFALGRLNNADITKKATDLLTEVYQAPPHELQGYLLEHGKVFFDLDEWFAYCKAQEFFIGTRIHGTIAGILGGTPSLLIAHDSRTVELATAMGIPFIMKDDIDTDKPFDANSYYQQAIEHEFATGYGSYWNRYKDFFEKCGLATKIFG